MSQGSGFSSAFQCECSIVAGLTHVPSAPAQDGGNRTIRAVLTGALQETDGTTYNVATQMNAFVYNTVVGWCVGVGFRVHCRAGDKLRRGPLRQWLPPVHARHAFKFPASQGTLAHEPATRL